MRHPFDGIIAAETQPVEATPVRKTRRSLLKLLAGAVAGLFALTSRAGAQQQPSKNILSLALGEAGGTALTQAFKEEAGDPTKEPRPTEMLGEAGGPSTKALREEGGVTTQALGEEGATKRLGEAGGRLTEAKNEGGGKATTLALGEEGGRKIPDATTNAFGEEGGEATTLALGEEGGQQ